jgi:pimeloyl-ACP methyl ester carboxylesterase
MYTCSTKCEIIELGNDRTSVIRIGWEYYNKATPLIIVSHGNGHNLSEWYYRYLGRLSKENKVPVLSWDYPGYGQSTGSSNEKSVNDTYDKLLVYLDHPSDKLILIGQSIGCGCTLNWASQNKCAALVLITPFTSIMKTKLPFSLSFLDMWTDGEDKIKKVTSPILLVGAKKDNITPYNHSLSLHKKAKRSKLLSFNCTHNDVDWIQPVSDWIKENKEIF